MFDIGWSEMLVIVVVLIVVVGPQDLPKVMRMAGRWAAKARQMAAEFQNSIQDMAREADLDDVQREIKNIANTDVKTILKDTIDPSGEMASQMQVDLPDLNAQTSLKSPESEKSAETDSPEEPTPLPETPAVTGPGSSPAPSEGEETAKPAEPSKSADAAETAEPAEKSREV